MRRYHIYNIVLLAAVLIFIIPAAGCAPFGEEDLLHFDAPEISGSARDVGSVIAVVEAGMNLLSKADMDQTASAEARAIDPTRADTDHSTVLYNGDQMRTPAEVWTAAGGSGTEFVRIPSSGYFTDYPNPGHDSWFEIARAAHMDRDGAEIYQIKFYVSTDFQFEYEYVMEHYYTDSNGVLSAWSWGNLDSALEPGFIDLEQKNYSGDFVRRTVEAVYTDKVYGWFDAPWIPGATAEDLALYEYPSTLTDPVFDPLTYDHMYSVKLNTTLYNWKGKAVGQIVEYYAENTPTDHSGLRYETIRNRRNNYETVTRYTEDSQTRQKSVVSMEVMNNNQTTVYKDSIEVNADGMVELWKEHHIWYSAPYAGMNENEAETTTDWYVEQPDGSFKGWHEEFWGETSGSGYAVHMGRDGTVSIDWSTYYTVYRSVRNSTVFSIADPTDITLETAMGTFQGRYSYKSLEGTLTVGEQVFEIAVSRSHYTDLSSGQSFDFDGNPLN